MTLVELFELLKKQWKLVVALPVMFGLIMGIWSLTRPNTYTATTTMYVLSSQQSEDTITQSELTASQMLTNDVATLLRSDRVKREVAESLGLDSMQGYSASITNTTTTRVITLSVTGPDPEICARAANAYVEITSRAAQEVMDISSINSIDDARVPTSRSGPHRLRYMALGAAAGLFAAVAFVVLQDALNTRIRSGNEVEELLEIPILAHYPKLERS